MITPAYVAILALFFVVLSHRTIRLRRRLKVAVGDADQPMMLRAMRVHANCAEYAPMTLLVIFSLERQVGPGWWIHALGITLIVGRVVHAYGLSQVDEDYRFRVSGMALTLTALIAGAGGLIVSYAR